MMALGETANPGARKLRARDASSIACKLLVGFFDAPERRLQNIHALAAQGWAAGHITDDEYTMIYDAAALRQDVFYARRIAHSARVWTSQVRTPSERSEGTRKRRTWSTSGAMPPRLRGHFTPGENAVAAVIRAEVRRHGACTLSHASIAKSAGLSSTTVVKRFVRQARALGLIKVEHRPTDGGRHKTNVVTIISKEWQSWNENGPRESTARRPSELEGLFPHVVRGGGGTDVPAIQKKEKSYRYNSYGELVETTETPQGGLGIGSAPPTPRHYGRRQARC